MLVKDLISLLSKQNPESTVTLDTFEGISLLDIDDVYTDESGVILYGSVMNMTQSRGASKIPPQSMTLLRETFYSNTNHINQPQTDFNEVEYHEETKKFLKSQTVFSYSSRRRIYLYKTLNKISNKLKDLKIDGTIINTIKGPTVDTFELELAHGEKIERLENLEDDIGLELEGIKVRIVNKLLDRSTMGIEVPLPKSDIKSINLSEIITTTDFNQNTMKLPIVFGKDMYGNDYIKDLANISHLLIGGTTGSGKSIFLHSMLTSLLLKLSPLQLKLILIDIKRVELAAFSNIPHLLMPIINSPAGASISLSWALEEMERRNQILYKADVNNIASFNEKCIENKNNHEFTSLIKKHYPENETNFHLPSIVIIVDELAALLSLSQGSEIEQKIVTLSSHCAKVGIHLILATHRPDIDVLTENIKTNFPNRIAFRVPTLKDSMTVLNHSGAEKLLGHGDMLFLDKGNITRLQGAYIDIEEIQKFTQAISKQTLQYDPRAVHLFENAKAKSNPSDIFDKSDSSLDDEYYEKALELIVETQSASATLLQRRLEIGYKRALSLIDLLEANGAIGPEIGARPRKVFIKK